MPANVETMFYVREAPWHGLGTWVESALNSAEALEMSGLNWNVIQKPIMTTAGNLIPGYKANVHGQSRPRRGHRPLKLAVSPSLHELQHDIPDIVWDEIQALYDEGKSPMPRLEKAIAENDVECAKLFKKYKRELSEFESAAGHAITTHRRVTNTDVSKYDLIIIDEDIIYSTVIPNRETVSLSDLRKLRKKL